jgi:hypothetical protein
MVAKRAVKSSRGGARENAGRPPLVEGEQTVPVTIRMTTSQRQRLEELGGADWVRRQIDKHKLRG